MGFQWKFGVIFEGKEEFLGNLAITPPSNTSQYMTLSSHDF